MNVFKLHVFIFLSVAALPFRAVSDELGDFDGNGVVDVADIDYFWWCYECNDRRLDINRDGVNDNEDFRILVEDLAYTYFGDANLDGEFNSGDLVAVFQAGEYEDSLPGNSSWATGDWNGDFEFHSGDLVEAFVGGGYDIGPRPPRTDIGDFSGDGVLDINDINLLLAEIACGCGLPAFDLNSDGLLNSEDIRVWVEELQGTYLGDANLDGTFNTSDMVLVFQAGKYEQDVEALWDEGDWTGDIRFNSNDLVAAVASVECWGEFNGFGCGPRNVATVPEPSWSIWWFMFFTLWRRRRRRKVSY